MEVIQRNDIVEKLRVYQRAFNQMEEGEFESKFKREVNNQSKEMLQWEEKLKQFALMRYGKIQQMMGKDKPIRSVRRSNNTETGTERSSYRR